MAILDVLGPVMVGPSSSHTLGAMRIARFAYAMIGKKPKKVEFFLHGSFAETFKGHGTDRALLSGIMGLAYDDARIKDAFALADQLGIEYSFDATNLGNVHPNTVEIKVQSDDCVHEVEGSSVGGGAIRIIKINGVECDLGWGYDTLIVVNKDEPYALSRILGAVNANIANLYLRRVSVLEAKALTIIELDSNIERLQDLSKIDCVLEYYFVPKDDIL